MRMIFAKRSDARQALMPFMDDMVRHDRRFKKLIAAFTVVACCVIVSATSAGRYAVRATAGWTRLAAMRLVGLQPDRAELNAVLRTRRARTVERTRQALTDYYRRADPAMQRLFQAAAMDPDRCVIGSGRVSDGFLLSSQVFSADSNGRSYRLVPRRRSVWLRHITLHDGPFGLFLVPDAPEVRAAAVEARVTIDEPSVQTTNSWGLRGPEPELKAQARGIVLGDSFMQGTFNGDNDTPPLALQRTLEATWNLPVSILNTGHIGYAPEQYYFSLKEYGERFRPHFVVVSVCPNDFGPGQEVLAGRGDDWDEAAYWLGEIVGWCRARMIPCVLAPVPCDVQVTGPRRRDTHYPAPISDLFLSGGIFYCDGVNEFIDEHLRLRREAESRSRSYPLCALYNLHIADNHFSPAGAELWARIVARRLDRLMPPPKPDQSQVSPVGGSG